MEIEYGLADGALLQRGADGLCRCKAKISAEGNVYASQGELRPLGGGEYEYTGLPAGGPYEVTFTDDAGSRTMRLWVGDLWMLGGQSNMEGAGLVEEREMLEKQQTPAYIRCYRLYNQWDTASPVFSEPWFSPDACQRDFVRQARLESPWKQEEPAYLPCGMPRRGVGPGLYFALRMYEITGVPQGIVSCALGGSPLRWWVPQPENGDNLYAAMLRRLRRVGGYVRGFYWDQGESETWRTEGFTEEMIALFSAVRRDFGAPDLPVVQTQIAQVNIPASCTQATGDGWMRVREWQRTLDEKVENLATIASIDGDFDDLIHLSSATQRKMGARAANAMAHLCGIGGCPPPRLEGVRIRKEFSEPFNYVFDVHFTNAKTLSAAGRPAGFRVRAVTETEPPFNPCSGVSRLRLRGNVAEVHSEISASPEEATLFYGYGNMSYCNIVTETGYSLPAFGPLKVKNVQLP